MKAGRNHGHMLLYCLLLLLLLLFVYRDVFLHPHELLFVGCWDSWWLFGPNQVLFDHCVEQGEFPLWNPLVLCGTPFAANPQVQAFYLPNFLRSALVSNGTALWTHLGLFAITLVHLVIGGVGAFLLAKYHGLRNASGLAAGLVFMLSAGMVRRTVTTPIWPMIIAWTPYMFLLIRKGLRTKKLASTISTAVLGGLLYGLILLAGNPQLAIYIGGMIVVYAITDSFLPKNGAAFSYAIFFYHVKRALLLLAVIFVSGFLTASPLLLTAQEFGAHSTRASMDDVSQFEGIEFSTAPRHLLESLVVFPRCEENTRINSAGMIAFVLAVTGLLVLRDRSALAYAALFYVVLDFGLGPPFPFATVTQALVPFSFSSSTYAWFLLAFPLAMLAGFGVEAATEGGTRQKRLIRGLAVLGVFAVAYWVFLNCEHPVLEAPIYLFLLPVLAVVSILLALLFHWPAVGRWLLCGFVAVELLLWNALFLPYVYSPDLNFVSNAHRYPGSLEDLRVSSPFWQTNRRTLHGFPFANHGMYRLDGAISGNDPLQIKTAYEVISSPETEKRYSRAIGLETCVSNSYIHLFLKRPFWLVKRYAVEPLPSKDALFPPAGLAFFQESPNFEAVQEEHGPIPATSLLEPRIEKELDTNAINTVMEVKTKNLPGRTICSFGVSEMVKSRRHGALLIDCDTSAAGQLSTSVRDTATGQVLPLLSAPLEAGTNAIELPLPDTEAFEVDCTAYLDAPQARFSVTRFAVASDNADQDHKIEIKQRTANRVALTITNLEEHRVLLFTDPMYPGWTATVDGRNVPLRGANHAFKAIELGSGTHDVVFRFHSMRAVMGVILACVWLFLLLLVGLGFLYHSWSGRRNSVA